MEPSLQNKSTTMEQALIDAETAFIDYRYSDCLGKLDAASKANGGKCNAEIQYMKVKTLIRLDRFYEANSEREKYLTLALKIF